MSRTFAWSSRFAFACLVLLLSLAPSPRAAAQTQVKPWFLVILDTSGSMSGSTGTGNNTCGWPRTRMNDAKCALGNVVNATGDAIFGLGQFAQDALTAGESSCCPGSGSCLTTAAGTCGDVAAAGRMRVGIADDNQATILNLIDHNYDATCTNEVFPSGYTPLHGSLFMAREYFRNNVSGFTSPTTTDNFVGCRPVSVILLTDGEETCNGSTYTTLAPGRATNLRSTTVPIPGGGTRTIDIRTYVIGFGVSPGTSSIENIAIAGGTDAPGSNRAFYASNPTELSLALSQIVADSQVNETCDGADNDCDTRVDEGWALYCDPLNRRSVQQSNVPAGAHQGNTGTGVTSQFVPTTNNRLCLSPGELCNGADDDCDGVTDENPSGVIPAEQCGNGVDNDCDGLIDEGCGGCSAEICDNVDNDCDGTTDENVTRACGNNIGVCSTGTQVCTAGNWGSCSGMTPTSETCNGLDDNCDGVVDGFSQQCGTTDVGECQYGTRVCTAGAYGSCVGSVGPVAEICDGRDNDCDGTTDEQATGVGVACGSSLGVCDSGLTACQSGSLVCVGATSGGAETCDNEDDDCDGATDEGNPGGGAVCGTATGECATGNTLCVAGAYVCQGGTGPVAEICDGLNNDCDGATDEGNPGGGAACGTDVGECTAGTRQCQGGSLVCIGSIGGSAETCDGQDDDCDGIVDEGNPGGGQACGTNTGECTAGTRLCVNGSYVCQGSVGPSTEICDGLNNDCDGATDEGNPGGGAACGTNVGECTAGTRQCQSGTLVCSGEVTGGAETCDNQDDDCDGLVDEGNPGGGQVCGTNTGECTAGSRLCVAGAYVCQGEVASVTEICDGLDNDCDSRTDENNPGGGGVCGIATGECNTGTLQCQSASLVCVGALGPSAEICDAQDDDCDGIVDEGNPGGGASCGTNTGECTAGTNLCVNGSYICQGQIASVTEICDGLDNDCDGNTDENNPGGGGTCGVSTGECNSGTLQCQSGSLGCVGATGPATELCDARDNDCDGITDEGNPGGGQTCGVNTGECNAGTRLCVSGSYICQGQIAAVTEICDGLDNDCDSNTDENNPGGGATCGTNTGECTAGVVQCVSGALSCAGEVSGSAELCDARDNDCDGITDEGNPGGGQTCGVNTGECSTGTRLCVNGGYLCQGEVGPAQEGCDGLDNDCDSRTDEGNPGGGGVCGSDVGECTAGAIQCVSGALDCVGDVGGGNELCDGLDNDCDGIIDEGNPGGGGTCGMDQGECTAGTRTCVGGQFVCEGSVVPTPELCDARDNDCDGSTDEGNPGGNLPCGVDTGDCAMGTTACTGGALVCQGNVNPVGELCDTRDNDCDGRIDEGNPGGGGTCGMNDVGECEFGAERCIGGMLQCVGFVNPATEVCNGLDDDCDTMIDEGVEVTDPRLDQPCGEETGECTAGNTTCAGGFLVCTGGQPPITEVCNGLDDDCDGFPDDGILINAPCGTDQGECQPGQQQCDETTGAVICVGAIEPVSETCDALDNDCDGRVDEGLGLGEACGSDEGLCMEGRQQCVNGQVLCTGEVPPTQEACDCEDNDCDGESDEVDTGTMLCPTGSACVDCQCARECFESEFGLMCPTGKEIKRVGDACFCVGRQCDPLTCPNETVERGGEVVCAPGSSDVPACVCRNNACGAPCDGVVCGTGTACDPSNGTCVDQSCVVFGCPDGQRCDAESRTCESDPCGSAGCGADQGCRDGTCFDTCAGVTCDDGRCVAGECQADPCDGVSCDDGQVCDGSGTCVNDLCASVECGRGFVCNVSNGNCEGDPCLVTMCPSMQRCVAGQCVDEMAMLPDGGVAGQDGGVAGTGGSSGAGATGGSGGDAGGGSGGNGATGGAGGAAGNDADAGDGFLRVLATGGGGCACSVPSATHTTGSASGAWLGLGLLGWLIVRRTQRRRALRVALSSRAAAIVSAVLVLGLGGCKLDPFCVDCVETGNQSDGSVAGSGGSSGTSGSGGTSGTSGSGGFGGSAGTAGATPDSGVDGGDAGQCMVNELCNGVDDDCDENVDEGFDTNTDTRHCGACNQACAPDHALGQCVEGDCRILECDVGFIDLDRDQPTHHDNGCEYRCLQTGDDDALCDLRDNDCDGQVDEDVALDTDPVNCGACGFVCRFAHALTGSACAAGTCTLDDTQCDDGFHNVDGVESNGCEYACQVRQEGGVDAPTELCNLRDDDCDGEIDEDVSTTDARIGVACGNDQGECQAGVQACVQGQVICQGETAADTEVCDGLDNDCDGALDEADPQQGIPCGESAGTCDRGLLQCNTSLPTPALQCVGGVGPVAELCDGLDNDCDNQLDEGNPQGGATCGTSDVGACALGITRCAGGVVSCDGDIDAVDDVCDGIDNDCDGTTDENNPGGGGPCGTSTGECNAGQIICTNGSLQCTGGSGPQVETCDALDNDCDGKFDEGNPGGGAGCGTDTGVCGVGVERCISGSVVCQGAIGGGSETCDGQDNDCDGNTDENNPGGGASCGTDVGECTAGSIQCQSGSLTCVGRVNGSAETCDNLDNDCDGRFDEGNPGGGMSCGSDTGACVAGLMRCVSGAVVCTGATNATTEACDGQDNDCDGNTDENNPGGGASCGTDVGECVAGSVQCQSGALACVGRTVAAAETCDSLDNDCDGSFDEGNPGGGQTCGTATGECATGVRTCFAGSYVCQGAINATDEVCDGQDDDCDGNVDEGNPGGGASCGSDVGECSAGSVQCQNGALSCVGAVSGTAETCDNQDDDCDGRFDEGNPGGGQACGTNTGECSTGTRVCLAGAYVCQGAVSGTTEVCDGQDDDCDGNTDEGNPGGGGTCGSEVGECELGSRVCQGGSLVCIGAVGGGAETCDTLDNDCDGRFDEGNPGGGASCGTNTGECSTGTIACTSGVLACTGAVSGTAEECDGQDDDCDGNTDEGNPGGGGACGSDVGECSAGTRQCQSGSLVCVGAVSGTTETCDGQDDDCDGNFDEGNPGGGASCGTNTGECTAGTLTCAGGAIVCAGAVSGTAETCDGQDDDCDGNTDEGNPGGGDACGSDVGECNAGTRQCQSGSLVCIGASGGTAETCDGLDNDCDGNFDEGNPGGGASCGTNTGECTAGTITCAGGSLVCQGQVLATIELCDTLDQDCDGNNTNGFNLQTDVRNCGTCNNQCSFQNGIAGCSSGGCTLLGCQSGYFNDPGIAGNDCLYQCNFTGAEICDGQDNDCDGSTDESLTPPAGYCVRTGVCSNPPAATCGGLSGWTCNYSGISTYQVTESRCDNLDNDCDGTTDEAHPTKGAACGVGTTGQCYDPGTLKCNTGNPTGPVICLDENNQPPVAGTAGDEICDGIDNDCDMNVDEPCSDFADQNQGSCVEEGWAPLSGVANTYVMQYEASRPNATALSSGTTTGPACSKAGVMPWTNVTYAQARTACQAAGGDLCPESLWQHACQNPSCTWSYSASCTTYAAQTCNGNDYGDTADAVLTTGALNTCSRTHGGLNVFDLSGNVREWAFARSSGVNPLRGGASNSTPVGISCGFDFSVAGDAIAFPNIGFRCCKYAAPSGCTTYNATGVPLAGSDPGAVTSTITVPVVAGRISDLNVTLVGTTDRFQDMRFSITSPQNLTRQIINSSRCGSDDNWSFTVDDAAANVVTSDNPFCNGSTLMGGGGSYRGAETLSIYNGENPTGVWTLYMEDTNSSGGAPSLTSWSIQVCRN